MNVHVRQIANAVSIIALFIWMELLLSPQPAYASNGIFQHQQTEITANETVDHVVAVGGDASINGTVSDFVLVINGDLYIQSSAHIIGQVVVVGGRIHQEAGARVDEGVISLSMDQATTNSLLMGGALAAGVWVIRLLASILLAIIPALAVGIFKHKMTSTFQMKEQEPGLLLLTGFFSSLLAAAITLIFAVSIIGLPLALLIILLAAYAFLRGMTEISFLVGSRIRDAEGKEPWKVTALGAALLTAGMNVPLFGALLFLGLLWASLGITTLKLWRKVTKKP